MSALASLNGLDVLTLRLFMPLSGPWVADVYVDSASELTGGVTLKVKDEEFKGFIRRGGLHADAGSYRVVGGAGGLAKTATPKSYRQTPLSIPLNDILSAAGETLSALADSAITSINLTNWIVAGTPCGQALKALIETQSGANWRVLDDGTLWVGAENWSANDQDFILTLEDKSNGRRIIDIEAATIRPGQTFDGKRIANVAFELDDTADVVTTLWEVAE